MANTKKTKTTAPDTATLVALRAEIDELKALVAAQKAPAPAKTSGRKGLLRFIFCVLVIIGAIWWGKAEFNKFRQAVNPFGGFFQNIIPDVRPDGKRERKARPDNNDDGGGIRWKFIKGVTGARDLAAWVRGNAPDAPAREYYDVADAFYDAADAIEAEPQIDEPAEAVAAARQFLARAASSAWTPFLRGLDSQANSCGIASIGDVCDFYYAVAGALYDAAAKASAAAAPSGTEPGPLPPSASDAEPAKPAAPEAPPGTSCPGGNCPAPAASSNGYNYYNYGYGWRWF